MFNETVAQNPTTPVSEGIKKRKNSRRFEISMGGEHGSEPACPATGPKQKGEPDEQEERSGNALQEADSLDATQNYEHVQEPEKEKTDR